MSYYDDLYGESDALFDGDDDRKSTEYELVQRFFKSCDNNTQFIGDDEELELIIVNLIEQLTLFGNKDTESYLKKALSISLKSYPDIPVFKVWNMRYLFLTKKVNEAVAYYNTVIEDHPSDVELYEEMAVSAYEYSLNDFDPDSLAKKAIALEPTPSMYILRAKISLDNGNVSEAFDCFQEAYNIDNSVLDYIDDITIARHFRGADNYSLDKYQNCQISLNIDNDEMNPIINIPETDMQFLEYLTETYPLDYAVWRSVGNACMFRKEYFKAIEAFQFSISAEQNTQSYISLCQAYLSVKDYDKTIEYANYINKHLDNVSANVIIASVKRAQNMFSEALSYLCAADQTDFNFPILIPELVLTLDDAGRIDELPFFFSKISEKVQLNVQESRFLLEVFHDLQNLEYFNFVCERVRSLFSDDYLYCAFLTMTACELEVKGDFIPFKFLGECLESPLDDASFEHLGYFMAVLHLLDNNPEQAEYHLKNAIVINENNIYEDFLDIDVKKLYTQYQNIFNIVYPYL